MIDQIDESPERLSIAHQFAREVGSFKVHAPLAAGGAYHIDVADKDGEVIAVIRQVVPEEKSLSCEITSRGTISLMVY